MRFNKLHLTLFIILAIDAMNFGLVIPVLPKLFLGTSALLVSPETSVALRYSLMGLVLGVYPFAVCLGTPILSIASDRFGRKPILFLSLLGSFFGLLFAAFSLFQRSILLLLVSRIFLGIFSASQPIATAAIADISHTQKRPYYLSLVAFSMTVGMLAGPLLGGFLSDKQLWLGFSIYTPFIVAACFALINIILMLLTYRETLPCAVEQLETFKQYLTKCRQTIIQPSFLNLIIIFVLLEMAWSLFFQTEPVLLASQYHFNSEQQSLYITFLGVVMCFGLAVLFKPLSQRLSLPRLAYMTLFVNSLGYGLLIFSPQSWMRWIAPIAFTLGVGICYTAVLSQMSLRLSKHEQGWLMGFTAALLALSWAITGFIGTKLLSISPVLPVSICFGLTLITLPFAYFLLTNKQTVVIGQIKES
tara:strand:+ start:576 stop:1826 length:1251 start_codon:yes stop_codon:yes gene_type:complete